MLAYTGRVVDGRVAIKAMIRSFIIVPASVAIYALVLDLTYATTIQPAFAYVGYQRIEPGFEVRVVVWLLVVGLALILPRTPRRASQFVLWVLFVVVVAPTVLMLPVMGPMPAWHGVGFGAGLSAAFTLTICSAARRTEAIPMRLNLSRTSFWLAMILFSCVVYAYVFVTAGINLQFVSVLDVYDVRGDYREAAAEAGLLGYLVATQANVVNPIIIACAIRERRWLLVVTAIAGQLVLYTSTGFKSILFSLVAILAILIFFKFGKQRLSALLIGASGLLLSTQILDSISGGIIWTSIFGRRFLFTPARLSGLYFEWYSNNPLSLLGNSILAPWVHTGYHYGPARTISIFATGTPNTSLNANVYASGFAEFGWFGVVAVAVLVGVYLRILDRAASALPVWIGSVVAVMPAVTLANSAFQSALLSHGLLASILVLAFVPRERNHVVPRQVAHEVNYGTHRRQGSQRRRSGARPRE